MRDELPSVSRGQVQSVQLHADDGQVEVRLVELNGRWLASADAPDGPTLGYGRTSFEALWNALTPYEPVIGDLLATMPAIGRDGEGS